MPRKTRIQRQEGLQKRRTHYHFQKKKQEKEDNMGGVQAFFVITYFVCTFVIFNLFENAEINGIGLIKLLCLLIGASFLIPIKFYRKWFTMSMYEYIFFNVLGFSTLFAALLFVLNFSFKGTAYEETYKIVNIERLEKAYRFDLENDVYKEKEYLRTIGDRDPYERKGNQYLSITFSDGLFGVRIIENKRLH